MAALLGLALVTVACGGVSPKTQKPAATASSSAPPGATASTSPIASATAATASVQSIGILVGFVNGTGPQSSGYDLALVAADGKVVAKAHAAVRASIGTGGTGGGAAAYDLPEVSASSTTV